MDGHDSTGGLDMEERASSRVKFLSNVSLSFHATRLSVANSR